MNLPGVAPRSVVSHNEPFQSRYFFQTDIDAIRSFQHGG
jgi:hypothetical protein